MMDAERIAVGLGWFSIGLGVTELVMGDRLSQGLGMGDAGDVVRAYGLREIASGAYILARPHDPKGVWSRVAGDFVDLGSL